MSHRCYECNREMTDDECVDGLLALDSAYRDYEDFEGPIHCSGPDENFLKSPNDDALIARLEKSQPDSSFEGSIVMCVECVERNLIGEGFLNDDGSVKIVEEEVDPERRLHVGYKQNQMIDNDLDDHIISIVGIPPSGSSFSFMDRTRYVEFDDIPIEKMEEIIKKLRDAGFLVGE